MYLSPPLARLIETFQQLPGIGPKTAQRLAFFVLGQPESVVQRFADALLDAKHSIQPCGVCHYLSSQSPCELCSAAHRDPHVVCVVADTRDVMALERTGEYRGLYHVLAGAQGGLISPLAGVGPDDLNVHSLRARLPAAPDPATPAASLASASSIQEVILALPPSLEGDTTSLYLARLLAVHPVRLTRIAFGLPAGGELEYADTLTISRALKGRVSLVA
jgi:recombination protein RecR